MSCFTYGGISTFNVGYVSYCVSGFNKFTLISVKKQKNTTTYNNTTTTKNNNINNDDNDINNNNNSLSYIGFEQVPFDHFVVLCCCSSRALNNGELYYL